MSKGRSTAPLDKANDKATKLFEALRSYEMNKQTGEVQNLIATLRTPEVAAAIAALDMTTLVNKIETANNNFAAEMDKRIKSDKSQDDKIKTAEQRKNTEAIYLEIVKRINAIAIVTPSAEVETAINQLNSLIDEYTHVISQMRSGGSGNEKLPKKEDKSPSATLSQGERE